MQIIILFGCRTLFGKSEEKLKKKFIIFKISAKYSLNIWLVAFAWKLYQIWEHRYNNFFTINLIHLFGNNMRFNKNHPFMTSPGEKQVTLKMFLNWQPNSYHCAKGKKIAALYLKLQPFENLLICRISIPMLFL